jgi:DNA polymerase-4
MDYVASEAVGFNPAPPTVMFVDLNSCFASIEQQANSNLRGKPIAVAAYLTGGGCILAPSIEAKRFGVATGMRVSEGRALCPGLIVIGSDPPKYRHVNRQLLKLLGSYTDRVFVKSIDEMVLHLDSTPDLWKHTERGLTVVEAMTVIAQEIKKRITHEIGDALQVSIGIAPNRYLGKIASGMQKPNGLTVIDKTNYLMQLGKITRVEELNGIKNGYGARLRQYRIQSALDFYHASIHTLNQAFHSIIGYHWWLRLHGYEADDTAFDRKSIGHSYALYEAYPTDDVRLYQILAQLSQKTARRMRKYQYQAQGIHLGILYATREYWHKGRKLPEPRYSGNDLYAEALSLLRTAPIIPVRTIDVSCRYLSQLDSGQQRLFESDNRKRAVVRAIDAIQDRWGDFSIMPGRMLNMPNRILDRVAFGSAGSVEYT